MVAWWHIFGASGQLSMMICDMTERGPDTGVPGPRTEARTTPSGSTQRLTLCSAVRCSVNTPSVVLTRQHRPTVAYFQFHVKTD